jgi:hypothetical protein
MNTIPKPNTQRRRLVALIAMLVPVFFSGCAVVVAGGAGAGTVAYLRGDLRATMDASMDQAAKAVTAGIAKLRLNMISEESDATGGKFIARTAKDEKISITLTRESATLTRISVRVGLFGDEALSRHIYEAISQSLP